VNVAYKVDVRAPVARFELLASQARNPERILKRWGGYRRSESRKAFAAQRFAPLADSTRQKLEQTRTAAVTAHGQVRKSYAGNLTKYLRGRMRAGLASAAGDLEELKRLAAGGAVDKATMAELLETTTGKQRRAVQRLALALDKARSTGKLVGGNRRRISRHKILGRLSGSIYWDVQGRTAKALSRVPWSGVHNLGGTAGHGARIPDRTYLEITQQDEVTMATIALQHLMGK
jgi:hypothetical protein